MLDADDASPLAPESDEEKVEDNRRKVDELSKGRLAYVWVPDTGMGGYRYFTRYYFAQQDKQGAIIDGGYMTAPRGGFYDTKGAWAVENEGVAPDVKVEQLPKLVHEGRDPQLEQAVRIALDRLETGGVELLVPPEDPVRVERP